MAHIEQPAQPEKKSSFGAAFWLLPRDKAEALSAVYAFCRRADDIVDEPLPGHDPKEDLAFWRGEIDRLYRGVPTHPISFRLAAALTKFRFDKNHFLLVIDGVEQDLEVKRYPTFEALEYYMYRVAGAVGLLCLDIFGYTTTDPQAYAKNMGYAVQLTNIIRDIAEDAANGRIYLPLEDLQAFGVTQEDILGGAQTENVRRLLAFEAERAGKFYAAAAAALAPADKKRLFAARVMGALYAKILAKIIAGGFDVFGRRYRLNLFEKLAVLFDTWRR